MKSRLNHLLPVALMFLIGAMTLWLRFSTETPSAIEAGRPGHEPDGIAEHVEIVRMDERGDAEYHVSATRMAHFPDNDSMELTAPRFYRNDAKADLNVSADRGIINQQTQEARFHDNVELVRRPANGKDLLTIRTQYMLVFMDRETASTDRNVSIVNGASTLTGTGMTYEKKTGQLTLLSSVKGNFRVQKK